HASGERDEQTEDYRCCRMSGRLAEQPLDDAGALTVEPDVSAQVIVDPFVGERTKQDDEREHREKQRGTEQDYPVAKVERREAFSEILDPRSVVATPYRREYPANESHLLLRHRLLLGHGIRRDEQGNAEADDSDD